MFYFWKLKHFNGIILDQGFIYHMFKTSAIDWRQYLTAQSGSNQRGEETKGLPTPQPQVGQNIHQAILSSDVLHYVLPKAFSFIIQQQ